MSDFVNAGWATYVAGMVVASLLFCVFILAVASKRKLRPGEDPAKPQTTGHVWDGDLQEINNPLPRWWVGLFIITIVFSVAYLFFYPGLGGYQGALKWSSSGQHQAELQKAQVLLEPVYAGYSSMTAQELAANPKAMAIGERLFLNNCAACHGSDAHGSKGFPNLTDSDWLYGGTLDKITETIVAGRNGNMPPMAAAVGTPEDVRNLANYVLSLSGSPHNNIAAQLGKAKFAVCAACHGPDGKGNQAVGAPNLTDRVWLHGWGEQAIVNIVTNGKNNQMPAHATRLTAAQIHVLAGYVWSLSNGSTQPATALVKQ